MLMTDVEAIIPKRIAAQKILGIILVKQSSDVGNSIFNVLGRVQF